jgi:hypothetical protein
MLTNNKMNVHLEVMLRSLAIFLSVFFTIRWGNVRGTWYDVYMFVMAVVGAIIANYY